MNKDKADFLNMYAKIMLRQFPEFCQPGHHKNWAIYLIEAEQPIPEYWRSDFYDELTSSDAGYRKALEESINYFGVRWS